MNHHRLQYVSVSVLLLLWHTFHICITVPCILQSDPAQWALKVTSNTNVIHGCCSVAVKKKGITNSTNVHKGISLEIILAQE